MEHRRPEEPEPEVLVDQGPRPRDVPDRRDQQGAQDRGGGRAADVADLAREVPGPLEAGVHLESSRSCQRAWRPSRSPPAALKPRP